MIRRKQCRFARHNFGDTHSRMRNAPRVSINSARNGCGSGTTGSDSLLVALLGLGALRREMYAREASRTRQLLQNLRDRVSRRSNGFAAHLALLGDSDQDRCSRHDHRERNVLKRVRQARRSVQRTILQLLTEHVQLIFICAAQTRCLDSRVVNQRSSTCEEAAPIRGGGHVANTHRFRQIEELGEQRA